MRFISLGAAALGILLGTRGEALGQAGRYIPIPRVPPGGGGSWHFFPFFHGSHGGGGDNLFWVIVAIVGVIVLAVVGWKVGQALAGNKAPTRPSGSPIPPLEDLIIQPAEVADKARRTTRLLEALARQDAAFNPRELRAFITATFTLVQQCWEARAYGPVRELLGPALLTRHEELLLAMRGNGEINRIEDLSVRRLEFVHVWSSAETDRHEITALITFDARVYFVDDRNGAFLRGSRKVIPYQEFWPFCRHGNAWRLESIELSHESERLSSINHVDGMTDVDRSNVEEGVIAL